jgi:hypothetical protein
VTDARLIHATSATAFLPEAQTLRRLPRAAGKPRPAAFLERFEDRALVYDCFRHADGQRILLVGPPPMNLAPHYRQARYTALPSNAPLRARHHASLSTMITELSGAPTGTTAVRFSLAGSDHELAVGPNLAEQFAGKRVVFTMSKDNDLAWVAEWARWHVKLQGANSVVFFDNGSMRYATGEIEETLLAIDGLGKVAVLDWPFRYGMTDEALNVNPFYVLFLQVSSMSVALRRMAAGAYGLMNCDVDELVATPPGETAFDLAHVARQGLLVMRGRYMEPVPTGGAPGTRTHRNYHHMFGDQRRAASRPRKWVLDPMRPWVRDNLSVHPYMHWIDGRPWFGKSASEHVFYRHFRAINTGWKDDRADAGGIEPASLVRDDEFAALVERHAF